MNINVKIGERIRALRIEKNISQESLAHLSDIDRTYMSGVELGKRNVSTKILEKIIIALGTDYKSFFNHKSFE